MKTNTDARIQIQVYYYHAPAGWVQVRNTEYVRKRDCQNMDAKNKSTSLGEACRYPARSPLLKRMGYPSNGHHSATYMRGVRKGKDTSRVGR